MMLCLGGMAAAAGKIVYPWNAVTSIVRAGEPFEVWFDAESGQGVDSVVLRGPYNSVTIPSEAVSIASGSWEYDPISQNSYNTHIEVTVPPDTPADRYDLILNTDQGKVVSISAVRVVSTYKTNYKILHISDNHMAQRVNPEGLIEAKHTAIVDMANIINPDFVFVTGDVLYWHPDPLRWQKRLDRFYLGNESHGWKGMHDFNAATFVIAGNHDYKEGAEPRDCCFDSKSEFWNNYHGLQYHTFTYGNSRFILLNNGWHRYDWSWQADRAVNWLSEEGSGGNLRIAVAHHPRPDQMHAFARENDLGLFLVGHYHHQGDKNPHKLGDKLRMYYALSIREYLEFNLLLVDDSTGSYTALGYVNTNDATDGYGLSTGSNQVLENNSERNNPDASVWVYNLTLDYAYDNDGSVSSNTATLVNKFDYTIPDARVRFVMPKGSVYNISKGTVKQSFDGDSFHIVDVSIDVDANSTATIDITPSEVSDTLAGACVFGTNS